MLSTAITVMATLDEIQPHRIAMKSSVTLEPSPSCQVTIYINTLLERNPPTEEDQSTNYALLPLRTSARAKCTHGETHD